MAYDGSGSLFALGMRLTRLDDTGAPLVGDDSVYYTDAIVTASLGLEYTDGNEITQAAGSGRICLYYKAPDSLTRGTISDLSICSPDPNVLQFLIGGDILSTGAEVPEVQTATITGTPTGGTFTLTYGGQTTATIAYNAAAGAVQSALEALSTIAPGDLTVTGSAGGPYTITWADDMGDVSQITASGAGLTGGTTPGVTMATTTPGDNFTDVGYAAPQVGVEANSNGVAIELWSRAVQDGAFASSLPYFHWLLPRAFVRPSDAWALSGEDPLLPSFEGYSTQNSNWGQGPADDWPADLISSRVWQYIRTATVPDFTTRFEAVS